MWLQTVSRSPSSVGLKKPLVLKKDIYIILLMKNNYTANESYQNKYVIQNQTSVKTYEVSPVIELDTREIKREANYFYPNT